MDGEDPRSIEIDTLEAIFPEIQRSGQDHWTFSLQLPIRPSAPFTAAFPAQPQEQPPPPHDAPPRDALGGAIVENHQLRHLPAMSVCITLPSGYPAELPPSVSITSDPDWLPAGLIQCLEGHLPQLWEQQGRDMVAFNYLDTLQQEAGRVFGLVEPGKTLLLDPKHKASLLDYDHRQTRADFERGTFDCGVCLEPKTGAACHRLVDCGHVFCLSCLGGFYDHAIKRGELASVCCPSPGCAKERTAAGSRGRGRRRKKSTSSAAICSISPAELLLIGIGEDTVGRYVALKRKADLQADKNTAYCPRKWCSGAARPEKHLAKPAKPVLAGTGDSDRAGDSDGESDDGDDSTKPGHGSAADLLAVCGDCRFAFCRQCFQSWHGEYTTCRPPKTKEQLTEEEKASVDYMVRHTSPCPTCNTPVQKSHGCNHMICARCQTHFCYLCSAWLDPGNPYLHYNSNASGQFSLCHMRLWELEHGDGDQTDVAGQDQPPPPPPPPPPRPVEGRVNGPGNDNNGNGNNDGGPQVRPDLNERQRAWVRRFVQFAMLDQEDLMEDDGLEDDEEENAAFAIS